MKINLKVAKICSKAFLSGLKERNRCKRPKQAVVRCNLVSQVRSAGVSSTPDNNLSIMAGYGMVLEGVSTISCAQVSWVHGVRRE